MKYFYRFLKDGKDRPIVTICTVENNLTYSRGIAICSPLDIKAGTFSKAKGKLIAKGRAEKAMEKGKSWNFIQYRGWQNAKDTRLPLLINWSTIDHCKCAFPVKLDREEKEFFKGE